MGQNHFTLQFLGTGNAWTKPPVNYHTNALITSNGKKWLIDCGSHCPIALNDLGVPLEAIDGAFISHLHGDHVRGLEDIILLDYFFRHRRIDLWLPAMHFTRYSGIQGADIWENCLRVVLDTPDLKQNPPKYLTLDDFLDLHLMFEGKNDSIFGIPAEIFEVQHIPNRPCFGLVLDGRAVYTSDSTFSRKRIEKFLNQGVSTIFHDVSFIESNGLVHAAFEDFSTLPREMAEHIVFMHYADTISQENKDRAADMGFRFAQKFQTFEF